MNRHHQRAFVFMNGGLGNGVIAAPAIAALETGMPGLRYDAPHNALLESEWVRESLSIAGPSGRLPTMWRRFALSDHDAILNRAEERAVSLVVNLRKEDPALDGDYLRFRKRAGGLGIECWDLHELDAGGALAPIGAQALAVLHDHGIGERPVPVAWLAAFRAPRPKVVGLCVGASVAVKRWAAKHWVALATRLLGRGRTVEVVVGTAPEEEAIATEIARRSGGEVTIVRTRSLVELRNWVASLDHLVSNDTLTVHLGAALGCPTVGIYLATLGDIWAPVAERGRFVGVQSEIGVLCPKMKVDGSCERFYRPCPAPCGEVGPGPVLAALDALGAVAPVESRGPQEGALLVGGHRSSAEIRMRHRLSAQEWQARRADVRRRIDDADDRIHHHPEELGHDTRS